jgi:hypothetical protein
MNRIGGWTRLGIVLTLLWMLAVFAELWIELKQGPFSLGLLTETVVAKTGEPISVLDGNRFRDLVPVDQALKVERILSALLIPVLSMWLFGLAWAWVRAGFRSTPKPRKDWP